VVYISHFLAATFETADHAFLSPSIGSNFPNGELGVALRSNRGVFEAGVCGYMVPLSARFRKDYKFS
jgi:hypothetical protein